MSLDEASSVTQAFLQQLQRKGKRRISLSVSHCRIPAPTWCRLPSDTVIPHPPFRADMLPSIFTLDSSSRCSCGADADYLDAHIRTSEFTIYTIDRAYFRPIQTVYCRRCPNTHGRVGPDLGCYRIFNWNNKFGFTHDLMNHYTKVFTSSETPFFPFHQSLLSLYEDTESPVPFCTVTVFQGAYFSFMRLQEIESNMRCPLCGTNPETVIADGVSISFAREDSKNLEPPSMYDKTIAHVRCQKTLPRSACFAGPVTLGKSIYRALDDPDREQRVNKLTELVETLKKVFLNSSLLTIRTITPTS
jgi:hypothetical protein